jgi:hypothetical protein
MEENTATTRDNNDTILDDTEVQDRINSLMRHDTEIKKIKNYVIQKHLEKIDKEGSSILLKAAFPSFLLLILSFFIDVGNVPLLGKVALNFANWLFPGTEWLNQAIQPIMFWWLPIVLYIIFVLCAYLANRSLKNEVSTKGASEAIIGRIIERYAGIVDGLGTAMPLLGAAILLVSIKEGATLFIGFSVPFEIKSIIILAIAKLFNSVFETQALRYSEIHEDLKKVESEYFYEQQETIESGMLIQLQDVNKKLDTVSLTAEFKGLNREEAETVFKIIKLTSEVSDAFAKNIVNLKNAVQELSMTKVFESGTIEQVNNVSNTLANISAVVQKSTEYSNILKDNLNAVKTIVSEINSVKMPDEKALKELQITAHFLSETVNNMKDTNAMKSLDNLVYLAGKR